MNLTFLGAAGTVTGPKYLLRSGASQILVDCGLFQGYKQLRLRNREQFPVDPADVDAVVLTHAHLDHSGYLPILVRDGFRGKIYCTEATFDLCKILLPDSGRLLEEEAEFANRRGYSKHHPALPLYTEADAERALRFFSPVPFGAAFAPASGVTAEFSPAGHILGAAIVSIRDKATHIVFSGDLGRTFDPVMPPPAHVKKADYVVVESTYGNRRHDDSDPIEVLGRTVRETVGRGGVVVIPSFAVGRAQTLLYFLHVLKQSGAIPASLPVYLNSPMAVDATLLYRRHASNHKLGSKGWAALSGTARVVTSVEESKALNQQRMPMIIIAGSGMATGGRVLHHLKAFAPDPRNTILLTGYQAGGTRGASMLAGADSIKIHGEYVKLRAQVAQLNNLSGHADSEEILTWLSHFEAPPKRTFIVHGEPDASDALRRNIEERLHWHCTVPEHLQEFLLGAK